MRRISQAGIELTQHFEELELEAYPDPGSPLGKECTRRKLKMRDYRLVPGWSVVSGAPWTIGWGHTGPEVKQGLRWTRLQADRTHEADIQRFERDVNKLLKVEVTQGQFDALVSFAFNVGSDIDDDDIAEGLGDSTLLKFVNARRYAEAAEQFPRWNKSRGQVLAGLTRRRLCEQALFRGEDWRKAA